MTPYRYKVNLAALNTYLFILYWFKWLVKILKGLFQKSQHRSIKASYYSLRLIAQQKVLTSRNGSILVYFNSVLDHSLQK